MLEGNTTLPNSHRFVQVKIYLLYCQIVLKLDGLDKVKQITLACFVRIKTFYDVNVSSERRR